MPRRWGVKHDPFSCSDECLCISPCTGLVGVLGLLKDKGQLGERQVWAGRNSDKSKVALIGLDDVYTGGASEERVARSVEAALTRKDEFGRILTPKERFRELCYQFHGKVGDAIGSGGSGEMR